jgi:hypothetical protein
MLELGRIRPGFLRQPDEHLRPLQVAVMVGGDIRDEIDGLIWSYGMVANFEVHKVPPNDVARLLPANFSQVRVLERIRILQPVAQCAVQAGGPSKMTPINWSNGLPRKKPSRYSPIETP